ncbi:MAG: CDP-diacylglycerol diphosphatase [Enterobacteriaceae bacterium]
MTKIAIVLSVIGYFSISQSYANNRDILWDKVHNQCVPAYQNQDIYAPCSLVDENGHYVIFKVDVNNDKYQYLLLPTDKITGVEDKQLLSADTQAWFYQAWSARALIAEKLDRKIKERDISLTVNSINARTQDQLHIHISCLSPDIRKVLDKIDLTRSGKGWQVVPQKLKGHTYSFRKLTLQQLKQDNLFQWANGRALAEGKQMRYTTLAVVNMDKNNFLLLASFGDQHQPVAAEALQDHTCSIVRDNTHFPEN